MPYIGSAEVRNGSARESMRHLRPGDCLYESLNPRLGAKMNPPRRGQIAAIAGVALVLATYVGSYVGHRALHAETLELPMPFGGSTISRHLRYDTWVTFYAHWPLWRLDQAVTGLQVHCEREQVETRPY